MQVARLGLAALMVAAGAFGAGATELVKPFEVLEQSRRAEIELDKRLRREAAERQQQEREREAKRRREEAEQRKRERQERARQEADAKRAAAGRAAQRPPNTPAAATRPQPATDPSRPGGQGGQP